MKLFDSHCHFDFTDFDRDRDLIWRDCRQLGVEQLLIPGVSPRLWSRVQRIADRLPGALWAVGVHPWWAAQWSGGGGDKFAAMAEPFLSQGGCVAIGECGLDAAIGIPLPRQQALFEYHLQLACEWLLPIVVHVRDTHPLTLQLLRRFRPSRGGVIHAFSGSPELAAQYWRLGFYLGIGGTITYPRAAKTRRAAAALPLSALLLETDAPDMPLSGFQGQRNSPLQLPRVAQALAGLRGVPVDDIARQTVENSLLLFER